MKRKVKIAQFGIGKMGSLLTKYSLLHGGEIVAAFARNEKHIGRDVGEVAGLGSIGVAISNTKDADAVLKAVRPDICLISTIGTMAAQKEIFKVCVQNGANVLTIGEEALWPWPTAPEVTREIDELAKQYGCTVSASGCPEIPWGTLVATVAGSSARIDKIRVEGMLNLEDYGKGVLPLYPAHGIGVTMEEFKEDFAKHEPLLEEDGHIPCYPGDQNGWLCNYMGLTVKSQTASHTPLTYHEDVWSGNLGRMIPAGNLLGMTKIVTTETEEGITVEYAMSGKAYSPEDYDHYKIILYGEPDTTIIINNPVTPVFTCATPVNRIPDVINARPGFVTTEEFPRNSFLVKPMNEYVNG